MEQTAQVNTQSTPQCITKDMTLGDIVAKFPQAIEVMLANGLHCVGCNVSYWETLEQGAMGHGMSQEQFESMLEQLNKVSGETPSGGEMTITQKATDKIKQILVQQQKEGWGLRVSVIPGGCSGYSYGFDFAKEPGKNDIVINTNGIMLVSDEESMRFLKGAKIDYVDTLQGAGFKVSNPNATSGCGCGQSFGA